MLVVWKLVRLGRSMKDFIEQVEAFGERESGFKSLQESIDTTTPGGRLTFHIGSWGGFLGASPVR